MENLAPSMWLCVQVYRSWWAATYSQTDARARTEAHHVGAVNGFLCLSQKCQWDIRPSVSILIYFAISPCPFFFLRLSDVEGRNEGGWRQRNAGIKRRQWLASCPLRRSAFLRISQPPTHTHIPLCIFPSLKKKNLPQYLYPNPRCALSRRLQVTKDSLSTWRGGEGWGRQLPYFLWQTMTFSVTRMFCSSVSNLPTATSPLSSARR